MRSAQSLPAAVLLHAMRSVTVILVAALATAAQNPYPEWRSSRQAVLNTSATGAGTSANVLDFPVVIRLNPGNFGGFADTRPGGADIRFAGADGVALPYHIERWLDINGNLDSAEIWVKVDTVYANNATQFITMFWGNDTAQDRSSAAAVFASAGGFQGVWHLGEEQPGVGTAGVYVDASSLGRQGTDNITDIGRAGIIGYGHHFTKSASDHIAITSRAALSTAFTLMAWVRADEVIAINDPDTARQRRREQYVISNYQQNFPNRGYEFKFFSDQLYLQFGNSTGPNLASIPGVLVANQWIHVAATWQSNGTVVFYRNGQRIGESAVIAGPMTSNTTNPTISANSALTGFNGSLDEVVEESVARSADWIKLCYKNQLSADSLVQFASCTAPAIVQHPAAQTVNENAQASFSVVASGTSPSYQWYRNSIAIQGARGASYAFVATAADNGALFSCVVSGCGSSVSSQSALLSVNDVTPPVPTTTLTVNALGPTTADVRWTTPESSSPDADSVWVFGSSQGYPPSSGTGALRVAAMRIGTGAERSQTVSGLTANTKYYFVVYISDLAHHVVAADSDTVRTAQGTVAINPVVVRGRYLDDTHVVLTLSNFCALPSARDLFQPWTDTVGIWYQAGTAPTTPDRASPRLLRLPLARMKAGAGCPGGTSFDTTVLVAALVGQDSAYQFAASPFWHTPEVTLPFVAGNGDAVLMRNVAKPGNPCSVAGGYPRLGGDSALIVVSNIRAIHADSVAGLRVTCSFSPSFADTIASTSVTLTVVYRDSTANSYTLALRDSRFAGDQRTVYCEMRTVGHNGVESNAATASFVVGLPVAVNPVVLAAVAISSYQVRLSWNSLAGLGVQRIRIAYDTLPIAPNTTVLPSRFPLYTPDPNDQMDTVEGLSPLTTYYFGAQAYVRGQWTAVVSASLASAATLQVDSSRIIANTAVVDSVRFDSTHNRIIVKWHWPRLDSVLCGIAAGVDPASSAHLFPQQWSVASIAAMTSTLDLGESVLFDTTYHVYVWLRKQDGPPAGPAAQSSGSVRTTPFGWQPLSYFRDVSDTLSADNARISLWSGTPQWDWGVVADTAQAWALRSVPTGLQPVGPAFEFRQKMPGPTLGIGMRYDSIPAGYDPAQLRIYRYTPEGTWVILDGSAVIAGTSIVGGVTRLLDDPFVLMLDRQPPTISRQGSSVSPDSAVAANTVISDTFMVADNTAGVHVSLRVGRGGDALRDLAVTQPAGGNGRVVTTIPAAYVTEDNGVRALLIITDGVYTDTIDLSHRVRRLYDASDISTEALRWMPLRTTAELDSTALQPVISRYLGTPGAVAYDINKLRVFRWFDPQSTNGVSAGPHAWVEFGAGREALFSLEPGRLMWVKGKSSRLLQFGKGVSLSLHDALTVILPPNNWTDFALPFRYRVYAGDVLDATGSAADTLQFYVWQAQGTSYSAAPFYIRTLPDTTLHSRASQLGYDPSTGYTVYNPTAQPIQLRIPPVNTFISSALSAPGKALVSNAAVASGGWLLSVVVSDAEGSVLGRSLCGYQPGAPAARFYPAPPSFANAGVRVCDPEAGLLHGHAVLSQPLANGFVYDLAFYNQDAAPALLTYRIEGLDKLGRGTDVAVVDPVNGTVEQGSAAHSVLVPAKGTLHRSLSVGGPGHNSRALASVRPFTELATYPNPVRGSLTLRFLLPETAGRIDCRMYDGRGRQVWKHTEGTDGVGGEKRIVWNTDQIVGPAASGRYVVRLSAFDNTGRLLRAVERSVVVVR